MASLTQQILRCCPLLKKNSIVNSAKQLRKQAVKTWTLPLQQSGLRFFCPYRYSCQLVLKNSRSVLPDNHVRFCSSSTELNQSPDDNSSLVHRPETEIISSSYTEALHEEGLEETLPPSPFEEVSEDETFQIAAKPPLPFESFSLRDYVDHSETLQKLVLLGVDLSKVEKRTTAGQLLLKLDFEKDIKKFILFLKDVGVEDNQLGPFITKNPYIFKEELEDLKTRVAYLTSKKFSKEAIAQMVSGAPYLLLFSVERLDNRLGFFQKELGLNVQKTRDLVTRLPRLLTESLEPVKENLKVCELELGFSQNEIRHIVHIVPKILRINKWKLIEIFDYVHNIMGIPHSTMVHFPQVFNSRLLRIKERHMFLKFIGRAQYDPKQPNYVSLEKLASLPDDVFCTEIAKVEKQDFQIFLKTL